tara:strand:- start:730 stop:981 length:252 start_codon:yes stop_codon:yes gene_type:complete
MSVAEKVFVSMNAGKSMVIHTNQWLSIRHVRTVMELDKRRVIMTDQDICDYYDENPDLTIRQLASYVGLSENQLKDILMGDNE